MKLSEQARELFQCIHVVNGNWQISGKFELTSFFMALMPVIQEYETRQELICDFNAAHKTGQIIAVSDERAERRTLAIAQMAAVLYAATREYPEIALPALNWSVNAAQTILAEVEKRG